MQLPEHRAKDVRKTTYTWMTSWIEASRELDKLEPDADGDFCAEKSTGRTTGFVSLSIHDFDFFRPKAFVIEFFNYNTQQKSENLE